MSHPHPRPIGAATVRERPRHSERRTLAVGLLLTLARLAAQDAPPILEVTGAVKQPLHLTDADLAKMPRASAGSGTPPTYDGVWLHELLKRAGAPQGETLRGKALAGYALAEASDGCQFVFSLAEVDPAFTDNQLRIAETANGKPLSAVQGPLRLIVPRDKHGSRSVRMLSKLEVAQLRK